MVENWRINFSERGQKLQTASEIRSHAHLKKAERWGLYQNVLGVITTLISAITSLSLLSKITQYETIIALLASVVTIFSALNTYFKPGEKKVNNEVAHKSYSTLSNDIKYFHEIECIQIYDDRKEAQAHLGNSYKVLNDRLSKLMQDSPMITEEEKNNSINALGLKDLVKY